jgi:hypothetical protein
MDALSEVAMMTSISTLGGPIGGGGAPSRPDASSGDGSSPGMSSRRPVEQSLGASPSHCMHTAPQPAWAPLVVNQASIPAACLGGLTRSFVCLCVCRGEDRVLARPGPPQQGRRYTSGEEVALRPALSARSSAGALSLASARL